MAHFAVVAVLLLVLGLAAMAAALALPTTALRPNLYFGTREKLPDSAAMQTSLAWFSALDKIRLECRHEDGLQRWGWTQNDGFGYGIEQLRDPEADAELSIEYLAGSASSEYGARINGTLHARQPVLSVLFAFACPLGGAHVLDTSPLGIGGNTVAVMCNSYRLDVTWLVGDDDDDDARRGSQQRVCTEHTTTEADDEAPELDRTHFTSMDVHASEAWNFKPWVTRQLAESARGAAAVLGRLRERGVSVAVPLLDNQAQPQHGLVVLQRVFTRRVFSVQVFLRRVSEPPTSLDGAFMVGLAERKEAFERDLEATFMLSGADAQSKAMASYAVGNLLGSHGYFVGGNMVAGVRGEYNPGHLFAGAPSRSFFPRGFLWDEGFQLLVVGAWNKPLAVEVLLSWLGRVDRNGWVAREQILGSEALSRVPAQFQMQNRSFGNPPTLLMALRFVEDPAVLARAFAIAALQYQWLVSTHVSPKHSAGFAWVGRSGDGRHTLTSGIDDYPRGYGGFAAYEAHVDLLAWIAWSEGVLADTAARLGKHDEAINYRAARRSHVRALDQLHWDAARRFYFDLGVVDEHYPAGLGEPLALVSPLVTRVPHVGYVGLMPFALGLIANNDTVKLSAMLDAMESENALRARGVGLRSLSKADALYSTGEDYWRGAVWININFLCVESLARYAREADDADVRARAKALHASLKADVVGNVQRQWAETGLLFENYHAETGVGRGTRPFTGWSSLVVLLLGR